MYEKVYPGNGKRSQTVRSQFQRIDQGHLNRAVRFTSSAGPILIAFQSISLFQFRHHHDTARMAIPNHSPKISEGVRQRSLGGDVGVLLSIPVQIISIDIITSGNAIDCAQDHARMVVSDDVGVAILRFVTFEFGVFPGELFTWIDRLEKTTNIVRTPRFPLDFTSYS